ncbi:MAG: M28 family peptidase [Bacteroidota bacterium]|jgi:hypothetical protein|nr:M28 family peptidase [Sphingobacteriales bacterium]
MRSFLINFYALFILWSGPLRAQQIPVDDEIIIGRLKNHISYLASDKLQGRLVGSKGEKKAYSYIIKQYKKYGAAPKGTTGYLQPFSIRRNFKNPHGSSSDTTGLLIHGHNAVAYIDNDADKTVIIGAHYDHLGYNEYGGSTYKAENAKEKPMIHNGADDNASGTAALIELCYLLKQSNFKGNNYLFIAFSGEEEGLLGSNYFTKNPTISKTAFNYMINMDMLGRLDTAKQSFAISGTGTSPVWSKVMESIQVDSLKIKYTESGTGSSDHTSFYYINVPALHYFTGTHYDYHKPSDDEGKINYKGELSVIKHIYNLIGKLDKEPKLVFTPTKEDSTARVSFKVTLGIMPDYLFEGRGVKVDGVTQGKPASNAGIKRGDVLIKLGDIELKDMQTYMKALGKFSKGETAILFFMREGKEEQVNITF